jgi:hypothetical protein
MPMAHLVDERRGYRRPVAGAHLRSHPLRLFHSSMSPLFSIRYSASSSRIISSPTFAREGELALLGIAPTLEPGATGLQEDPLPALELMRGHLALPGDSIQGLAPK